eukprot:g32538.t1
MEAGSETAMRDYKRVNDDRIDKLIRRVQRESNKELRTKVITIITIDVHSRDVIESFVLQKVNEANDFRWGSQLRFYWTTEGLGPEVSHLEVPPSPVPEALQLDEPSVTSDADGEAAKPATVTAEDLLPNDPKWLERTRHLFMGPRFEFSVCLLLVVNLILMAVQLQFHGMGVGHSIGYSLTRSTETSHAPFTSRLAYMCTRTAFSRLRIFRKCIVASLRILFWSLVLLMIIQCSAGMTISYMLSDYMSDPARADESARYEVFRYYGTFSKTILTMFEVLFANWAPACRVLIDNARGTQTAESADECDTSRNGGTGCFVGFAVLNVVNAVFVQSTMKVALADDEIVANEKAQAQADAPLEWRGDLGADRWGTSGRTGILVVGELLDKGYEVRALVHSKKSKEALLSKYKALPADRIYVADIQDKASLQKAFAGCAAAIVATSAVPKLKVWSLLPFMVKKLFGKMLG